MTEHKGLNLCDICEGNVSCEMIRLCMFEPINGREPDPVLCDKHQNCIACPYCLEKPKEE